AALAGRVDDDGGFGWIEFDLGEDVAGVALDEPAIPDLVLGGVAPGPVDRGFADLDADGRLEFGGGGETEQPGAAVGVDEVGDASVAEGFGFYVIGKGGEDVGIVLEEFPGV